MSFCGLLTNFITTWWEHTSDLEHSSLELRAYDFDMVHKPGRVKQNADALSRKLINLVGLCPALETLDLAQA